MTIRPRPRRTPLYVGLIVVQLLLMGSAFVGGRMLGQQNTRNARAPGAGQLPSQLPRDPAAATGSVTKIQDTVITVSRGRAPNQPGAGGTASSQTEITVSADTKYYKNVSSNQPGGPNQPQVQVADATLDDVKIGTTVLVWGTTSGARVTAQVIYVQNAGR